jgi:hypothetical protein
LVLALRSRVSLNSPKCIKTLVGVCVTVPISEQAEKPKFLSFHAFLSRGHHFLRIQRNLSHIRKENMPPDHFCYHLRQNGRIDLPSLPDWHIFIGVSENTHYGHLRCHNSHMATWLFDAIMAIRPVSHMAIMALNVGNMGVFGNGTKNVTIWRRR